MNRMYKFRIYPNRKQRQILNNHIDTCRFLYNLQLENKIIWYTDKLVNLSYQDLNSMLLDLRTIHPKIRQVHSQVQQDVNNRITKAFDKFIKEHKGYPRFKNEFRYNSITYPQSGFKFISNKHIRVSKIGNLFIVLHRLPKGKIKTLTIKRTQTCKWFAVFSCEVETAPITNKSNKHVGIDLGIENFATLSDGTTIPNPRYLIKSEQRLKLLQKNLCRKIKNSKNRRKAKYKVAKLHEKITNQRNDFIHKISRNLVNKYYNITIEDLKIKGMFNNNYLAKHIHDVAWKNFTNIICYKGEETGCRVEKVNPKGTSKRCNNCGNLVYKKLSNRMHYCPCGFKEHRDINASYNIISLSTAGTAGCNALGAVSEEMAMIKESTLL